MKVEAPSKRDTSTNRQSAQFDIVTIVQRSKGGGGEAVRDILEMTMT